MRRLFVLLFVALAFMSNSGCENDRVRCVYEVVEKSKDIDSHYNFFTEKQVVGTVYYVVLKDTETGNAYTVKFPADKFYQLQAGKRYKLLKWDVERGHYPDYEF